MNLEFEMFRKDYKKSLLELLFIEYKKRFLLIFALALISSIAFTKNNYFQLNMFLFCFMIVNVLLFSKSFYNIFKTDKLVRNNPLYIGEKSISVHSDGIVAGVENPIKYDWNLITKIINSRNYILVGLQNNTVITIKKAGINDADISKFVSSVESNIQLKKETKVITKNQSIYWLGIAGFIPAVGLIIGGFLIHFGFKKKVNKMIFIGLANILFNILIMFLIFTNNNSNLKDSNSEFENHSLSEVAKGLDGFKSINGHYPDSLVELRTQNILFDDKGMFTERYFLFMKRSIKLYYKKSANDYILKAYGADEIINASDPVYPETKKDQE
ncbi:hypothetical protein ACFSX9_12735 [Flavobacterium ardleyense]|uniref:YcxB-like protein domain-containing protein n=1 Tax=Flavobacterium ardleyense TaxID=2038737 RepID=A0ABW5ZAW6_9FLAO